MARAPTKPRRSGSAKSSTKPAAVTVRVEQMPHARGLPLPAYQTAGAAGLDLAAAVPPDQPIKLKRGDSVLVPTGLKLELPAGTEAQVRPRSGLALKHGITVLNSPGTIDCDYRGEVQVLLVNLGKKKFVIARGERIAQLVIAPVTHARLDVVATLSATLRGSGGFGSTGVTPARTTTHPPGKKPLSDKPARKTPRQKQSRPIAKKQK